MIYRNFLLSLTMLSAALLLQGCRGGGASASAGSSGDWTTFRGESSLSGSTEVSLPSSPKLLWSTTTGQRTVASPLVKDGIIWTVGRKGLLRAVDGDGNELFTKDFDTYIEATPLISDSLMFIGTMDGCLMAMGLQSREVIWHYWTQGRIAAPPVETVFSGEKAVVFGSYDNYLYTLRRSDGETLSRFETGYYLNGAAAVTDGFLAFGGCDQWLRIVDTGTGAVSDSLQLDSYIPGSPVFAGNDAYIGDYSGNIYHLTLSDGSISDSGKIYVPEPDDDSAFTGLPAAGRENLYFWTGGRSLNCISRKDGSTRWSTMLKGPAGESSPQECRNGVLACTRNGIISILDKRSGEVRWEYDAGEDILACPAVVPGRFYILTAKGTLLCFGN